MNTTYRNADEKYLAAFKVYVKASDIPTTGSQKPIHAYYAPDYSEAVTYADMKLIFGNELLICVSDGTVCKANSSVISDTDNPQTAYISVSTKLAAIRAAEYEIS